MTRLVRRGGLLLAVLATAVGLSIAAPRADAGQPDTPVHVDVRR
ncbi:hypothetical protein SAMN04489844_3796 [Nocardioides exalbidus]|uniref:Uncharacterized protein n=1 Tax=Nocardioides exalbidus TaxID=402596 RepID=A0A1H4YCD2_9ACTN|nr:hypothetical protein [Nocardioides exalbidus]SED15662.1 hypothetical protein SAMN04489844_3796 [Nocardioides exalbidus]